jgi:hypothetical protein
MKTGMLICTAFMAPMACQAHAKVLEMICENPRREYTVRFDSKTNEFLLDQETRYRVLAVEDTDSRYVVVGLTVNKGPMFRAHFRPYKKMEFFSEDQLDQTDGCK